MSQSARLLSPQATSRDAWRRETEARHWIRHYEEMKKVYGPKQAAAWWQQTIAMIQKTRGDGAARMLRDDMNKAKNDRPIQD